MDVLASALDMVRKKGAKRAGAPKGQTQDHFKGPLTTVDDDWKAEVREAMRVRGWDQKTLADKIPVAAASITNMFKPGPRQIRFQARIHELFDWPTPTALDALLTRLAPRWKQLSGGDAEMVADFVKRLTSKP